MQYKVSHVTTIMSLGITIVGTILTTIVLSYVSSYNEHTITINACYQSIMPYINIHFDQQHCIVRGRDSEMSITISAPPSGMIEF